MHARKAGAISDREVRPSTRIAKVMWPANDTESIVAWARKVQRDMREIPDGLRLCSSCCENRSRTAK